MRKTYKGAGNVQNRVVGEGQHPPLHLSYPSVKNLVQSQVSVQRVKLLILSTTHWFESRDAWSWLYPPYWHLQLLVLILYMSVHYKKGTVTPIYQEIKIKWSRDSFLDDQLIKVPKTDRSNLDRGCRKFQYCRYSRDENGNCNKFSTSFAMPL